MTTPKNNALGLLRVNGANDRSLLSYYLRKYRRDPQALLRLEHRLGTMKRGLRMTGRKLTGRYGYNRIRSAWALEAKKANNG